VPLTLIALEPRERFDFALALIFKGLPLARLSHIQFPARHADRIDASSCAGVRPSAREAGGDTLPAAGAGWPSVHHRAASVSLMP